MPRLSETGQFIIPASEIAAYTLCPESWRLRSVEQIRTQRNDRMNRGKQLHDSWASRYEESVSLARYARIVVATMVLAILVHLLLRGAP